MRERESERRRSAGHVHLDAPLEDRLCLNLHLVARVHYEDQSYITENSNTMYVFISHFVFIQLLIFYYSLSFPRFNQRSRNSTYGSSTLNSLRINHYFNPYSTSVVNETFSFVLELS